MRQQPYRRNRGPSIRPGTCLPGAATFPSMNSMENHAGYISPKCGVLHQRSIRRPQKTRIPPRLQIQSSARQPGTRGSCIVPRSNLSDQMRGQSSATSGRQMSLRQRTATIQRGRGKDFLHAHNEEDSSSGLFQVSSYHAKTSVRHIPRQNLGLAP